MPLELSTVTELLDKDEAAPLEYTQFDDALWDLLCQKISSPEDATRFPRPVALYFASRYVQWDVDNGGFAQAAYNVPEWFKLAAEGYRALQLEHSANIIEAAAKVLPKERNELEQKGLFQATIGQVFDHFRSSRMALFDTQINRAEWEADDRRVEYVRNNRDAFRAVDRA